MLTRFKTWWDQWRCGHYTTATRTFIDGRSVKRETVCLQCAKKVPIDAPPIEHDALVRMLDKACTNAPPSE